MYYLIVFKMREQSIRLAKELRAEGAQIVNTPRELGLGCGLSVRLAADPDRIWQYLVSRQYTHFYGLFCVRRVNNRTVHERIR